MSPVMGKRARRPVIGWPDGTGYGRDGTIWGGEFFVVRITPSPAPPFPARAHARGDQAAREPVAGGRGLLSPALGEEETVARARLVPSVPRERLALVERMLREKLNCPLSSGAGRTFDAAASLILGRHRSAYRRTRSDGAGTDRVSRRPRSSPRPWLPDRAQPREMPWQVDFGPAFAERRSGFWRERHLGVSCRGVHPRWRMPSSRRLLPGRAGRITDCCLSGGVFQNQILLTLVEDGLTEPQFARHRNRISPERRRGELLVRSCLPPGGPSRKAPGERERRRGGAAGRGR